MSVHHWLQSILLEQYLHSFIQAGYNTLEKCAALTEDDLSNLGVIPPGHRKRILTHLPNTSQEMIYDNVPIMFAKKSKTESDESQEEVDEGSRPHSEEYDYLPSNLPISPDTDEEDVYVNVEIVKKVDHNAPPVLPPKQNVSSIKRHKEGDKWKPIPAPRISRMKLTPERSRPTPPPRLKRRSSARDSLEIESGILQDVDILNVSTSSFEPVQEENSASGSLDRNPEGDINDNTKSTEVTLSPTNEVHQLQEEQSRPMLVGFDEVFPQSAKEQHGESKTAASQTIKDRSESYSDMIITSLVAEVKKNIIPEKPELPAGKDVKPEDKQPKGSKMKDDATRSEAARKERPTLVLPPASVVTPSSVLPVVVTSRSDNQVTATSPSLILPTMMAAPPVTPPMVTLDPLKPETLTLDDVPGESGTDDGDDIDNKMTPIRFPTAELAENYLNLSKERAMESKSPSPAKVEASKVPYCRQSSVITIGSTGSSPDVVNSPEYQAMWNMSTGMVAMVKPVTQEEESMYEEALAVRESFDDDEDKSKCQPPFRPPSLRPRVAQLAQKAHNRNSVTSFHEPPPNHNPPPLPPGVLFSNESFNFEAYVPVRPDPPALPPRPIQHNETRQPMELPSRESTISFSDFALDRVGTETSRYSPPLMPAPPAPHHWRSSPPPLKPISLPDMCSYSNLASTEDGAAGNEYSLEPTTTPPEPPPRGPNPFKNLYDPKRGTYITDDEDGDDGEYQKLHYFKS